MRIKRRSDISINNTPVFVSAVVSFRTGFLNVEVQERRVRTHYFTAIVASENLNGGIIHRHIYLNFPPCVCSEMRLHCNHHVRNNKSKVSTYTSTSNARCPYLHHSLFLNIRWCVFRSKTATDSAAKWATCSGANWTSHSAIKWATDSDPIWATFS